MEKQFLENYNKFTSKLEEIYGQDEESNLDLYRNSAYLDDFDKLFMVTNVELMITEDAVKKGNEWLIEQCIFLEKNKEEIKKESSFNESLIYNEYKIIRLELRSKKRKKLNQTDYLVKVINKYFKKRPDYMIEKFAEIFSIKCKSKRNKRLMIAYEFIRQLDAEKKRKLFEFF